MFFFLFASTKYETWTLSFSSKFFPLTLLPSSYFSLVTKGKEGKLKYYVKLRTRIEKMRQRTCDFRIAFLQFRRSLSGRLSSQLHLESPKIYFGQGPQIIPFYRKKSMSSYLYPPPDDSQGVEIQLVTTWKISAKNTHETELDYLRCGVMAHSLHFLCFLTQHFQNFRTILLKIFPNNTVI